MFTHPNCCLVLTHYKLNAGDLWHYHICVWYKISPHSSRAWPHAFRLESQSGYLESFLPSLWQWCKQKCKEKSLIWVSQLYNTQKDCRVLPGTLFRKCRRLILTGHQGSEEASLISTDDDKQMTNHDLFACHFLFGNIQYLNEKNNLKHAKT